MMKFVLPLVKLFNMFITRNNNRIEVEQIRSAHTSLGYSIYLFRVLGGISLATSFIVAVKDSSGNTVEYKTFPNVEKSLRSAIIYYMDYLCCYC